ncbi:MAG: peptide ligase PGM1-related protein [Actinomycetota bacterium]|nr:peptide ligase PGM1-related protein [Actinomycetota bacterium]
MTGTVVTPDHDEWEARQRAFAERLGGRAISDLETGTIVVVNSITYPAVELAKITAAQFYEERLLFMLLLLRAPAVRIVYVTSVAVDPAVVDYHLRFLPDPEDARSRLSMVDLGDPSTGALSEKLLGRPDVVARVRSLVSDRDDAYMVTFNVTVAEQALSSALGIPLYGPAPSLVPLGYKSGSRRVARRAGVRVLDGAEDLHSMPAVEAALCALRERRPAAEAGVVKLNNGFSGQGSVMVELGDGSSSFSLTAASATFCAAEESWATFGPKVEAEGAIAEELLRGPGLVSPSVQLRISPAGSLEVISTHDQVLGGPGNQVYLGCRFPAHPDYRLAIQEEAVKVGLVLAEEGVIGPFGIDFLVVPPSGDGSRESAVVYLLEINLRIGGTTHPFWMARLATGGVYDTASGELVAGGRPKSYVATDNIKSANLVGSSPAKVIEAVDRAGLGFDPLSATGATLHLLGALPGYGKMGVTCIADSIGEAEDLYRRVGELLSG